MRRRIYCKHCGYSLRGIESGVCPECGESFDINRPRTYIRYGYKQLPFDIWLTLALQALVLVLFACMLMGFFFLTDNRWWRINQPWFSCSLFNFQLAAMICGLISIKMNYKRTVPGHRLKLVLVALIPWFLFIGAILAAIAVEVFL